jgi:hypothetical protein
VDDWRKSVFACFGSALAKAEGMKIMSHDRQFPQYGDFVIAV